MSAFMSGLELSRLFYQEAVRPILEASFPGIRHSAALLGRGSEVLGFDDETSRDHDWGAHVLLFLREEDHARHSAAIGEALRQGLPPRFRDHPTDCAIHSLRNYFLEHLDFDIEDPIEARDWLTFPEQRLPMITGGAVHHDEIGLQAVRDRFAYYPRDVWLYLLVAGWWRVHPEANLVGRAGSAGDELGSALIGSRLVLDLMRLCFLMEKRYAPYSKWFGTAFSQLRSATELSPILWNALHADTWPERENALMAAYEKVTAMHNALRITPPVAAEVHQLWDRPFKVLWGDIPGALRVQIQDPAVRRIADRWPVGGPDQFRDSLWDPRSRRLLLRMFE
ncbi:MAG: DUF4037 domain-containing protein [Actinopolymorphaceae bacterium]